MGEATYKIIQGQDGWAIAHDREVSGSYATREAAFEAVVGPASNAIKEGHSVTIMVQGNDRGGAALGKS